MMTTPTPETPVTDPKTETTPTTSQSPRQKDPKKVAAGRAGAAARKAKQAHLLEKIRKAKESQRKTENTPDAPLHSNEEAVAAPCTKSDKEEEKATPASAGSMSPWIIGVVAAGLGLAYWAASQRAPVDPPVLPPKKSVTPQALSPDGSAQQLKVTHKVAHNPHYME